MIGSVETVVYTLLFIIPGFIINSIICKVSPRPRAKVGEAILTHVFYSTFSAIFTSISLWEMISENAFEVHPIKFGLLLLLSIFIIPILLGVLFSILINNSVLEGFLRIIGFKPKSGVSTGWDKFFNKIDTDMFAKIFTNSGKYLYVKFEAGSHISSSEMENADIFASQIFTFDETDNATSGWELYESGRGVLIPRTSIQYIVFIDPHIEKGDKNGRKQEKS